MTGINASLIPLFLSTPRKPVWLRAAANILIISFLSCFFVLEDASSKLDR